MQMKQVQHDRKKAQHDYNHSIYFDIYVKVRWLTLSDTFVFKD